MIILDPVSIPLINHSILQQRSRSVSLSTGGRKPITCWRESLSLNAGTLDTSALRLIHQGVHLCIFHNCNLSPIQFETLVPRGHHSSLPKFLAIIMPLSGSNDSSLCHRNYFGLVTIGRNPTLHALMRKYQIKLQLSFFLNVWKRLSQSAEATESIDNKDELKHLNAPHSLTN